MSRFKQKQMPQPSGKYIIYWCVSRYLTEQQLQELRDDLGKTEKQQKKFVSGIEKQLDLEMLRTNPIHPLDILVYNYLKYEFKERIGTSKLLKRYYKEVM